MRKILANTRTLSLGKDRELLIHYYIIAEELTKRKEVGPVEIYGACIEAGAESSYVQRITTSQKRIEALIKLLSENFVTPIHLYDMVDDLLGVLF